MGEPALAIVDEAAGEQAAQQTVRFIVIEGGAGATEAGGAVATAEVGGSVAAGEVAAGGAAAAGLGGAAVATAGIALAVVGLAALAYYLYKRKAPATPELITRCSSAEATSSLTPENRVAPVGPIVPPAPTPKRCPPHKWIVVPGEKKPQEDIDRLRELAKTTKDKDAARGYDFEASAIDENRKRKDIEATNRKYRCVLCPAEAQPDIVFKDGQIAEASSRSAKQNANGKRDQHKNELDLQRQLNEDFKTSHKPMGKLDNSERLKKRVKRPDIDRKGRSSPELFEDRGFDVELLPPE